MMSALTLALVSARAKTTDLSTITQINLWGCSINDIAICANMAAVEVLALTGNEITSLRPLKHCVKLRELYLRNNKINDVDELNFLKHLPNLEVLCLTQNPFCERAGKNYRRLVLSKLPKLKKLDNEVVDHEEFEDIHEPTPVVPQQQKLRNNFNNDIDCSQSDGLSWPKPPANNYATSSTTTASLATVGTEASNDFMQDNASMRDMHFLNSLSPSPIDSHQTSLLRAVVALVQQMNEQCIDLLLRVLQSTRKERVNRQK